MDTLVGGTAQAQLGDPKQPFFARQLLVVRSNNGRIDPERLEDYLEIGGYQTLHHALHEMQPTRGDFGHCEERATGARRSRLSNRSQMGAPSPNLREHKNLSFATETKAIPVRTWIEVSWKAIPIE